MNHRLRLRFALGRLIACLALGVATTLVLAWTLAMVLPHAPMTKKFNLVPITDAKGQMDYVRVLEFRRPGMIRRIWWPGYARGGMTAALPIDPEWTTLSAATATEPGFKPRQDRSWGNLPAALDGAGAKGVEMEDARGWPFPALWCSFDAGAIDGGTTKRPVTGGFAVSGSGVGSASFRALPLMPIWRGLLQDTAIFAAAWLVGMPVFRLIRGRVRRWRGLCPRCAYSLARIPPDGCPECGWRRPGGMPEVAHPSV